MADQCVGLQTIAVFLVKLVPWWTAGWPVKRILAVCFMKSKGWIPHAWTRSTQRPTGENVKTFCEAKGLDLTSVEVAGTDHGPPCTLHFIHVGPSSPKGKILLYLHGGAYIAPVETGGVVPFFIECAEAAGASDLVVLEYTLAPELKYPGQLVQTVEAVNHLLQTYDPSQIILGGDSAGGHLVLSLFAHIKQPNPHAKPLLQFQGQTKFQAAVAICPWVKMKYNSKTFSTNESHDFISAKRITSWTEMWRPDPREIWGDLLTGGREFWGSGMPCKSILITTGEWECFHDDDVEMGNQLGAKAFRTDSPVELFVGEKEVHVQCGVDKFMGLQHSHSALAILEWLGTRVGKTNAA